MKYIVKVGFYEFTFTERDEALDFAETAMLAGTEKRTVEIQLKPEVENE